MVRSFLKKGRVWLMLMVAVMACDPGNEVLPLEDKAFFPMQVGSFFAYDVSETQYSQSSQTELSYNLKWLVVDSIPSLEGGFEFVLQRFTKKDEETLWTYLDTWSVRINTLQVVVMEGTTSFVKLSFPVSPGKKWNGNLLNNLGGDQVCDGAPCDLYEMIDLYEPFATDHSSYDQSLKIVQSNSEDPIVGNDVRIEVYAYNVGLVYKEHNVVEYCTVGACIGQKQIIDGYLLKQQLIDYGVE